MSLLELTKAYLRIDGSEDDDVLALLVGAAEGYLANAGVKKPKPGEDSNLYNLAVCLRVHRERARDEKEVERVERSLTGIILQLKTGI
ncbi:head-tail connector protein [Paenibacillus ihumii]|uniref:head-tail connector protein n=1 Tax=Paenibacillus ihumii TaxID=687436 RepID=UPI00093CF27C|nr:head-tail connector protein [Paenibacillus ihumii]